MSKNKKLNSYFDPLIPRILWKETLETWEGFHRTSRYAIGAKRNQSFAIL